MLDLTSIPLLLCGFPPSTSFTEVSRRVQVAQNVKKTSVNSPPQNYISTRSFTTMPPLNKQLESQLSWSSLEEMRFEKATLSRRRLPRKEVRFQEDNLVHSIPHFTDYTADEILAAWNSPAEYSRIMFETQTTLYMMTYRPECLDDVNYTSRGLEGRSQEAVERRHALKNQAWSCVMKEQEHQRQTDEPDQEGIATSYGLCAQAGEDEALNLARRDAQQEAFDDSWISCLCSEDCNYERATLEPTFDDDEGFDNAWNTDDHGCCGTSYWGI
jgi:hypothetical protein